MKNDSQLNSDNNVQKLGELIKGIKFAMFTSMDEDHNLHTCPLTTQEVDFTGDLWFIIGRNSQVFSNIQSNGRVNVNYATEGTYVSVLGTAMSVEDREKLEEFWTPSLNIWFEGGINDPNIALIQVFVESAEYWDSPHFKVTRLAEFAKALITGDKKVGSEHQKMTLN